MEEETDPEGRKMIHQASRYAAVGLEMGIAMALGVLGGRALDDYFGTKPVLFWIGFTVGVGAAFKAIVDVVRKAQKELKNGTSPPKED